MSSPSSAWHKSALSQPDRAQPHRELRPLPGGPHRAVDPPQEREHLCYRFARRHTRSSLLPYFRFHCSPSPITDILLAVDDATRFTEAFTHLRTGSPCRDRIGLLNVLLAEGINLGLRKMAEATTTHGF